MNEEPRRSQLEELARQLAEAVPKNLKALGEDLEKNFRSLLQAGFEKMDLVTREEFDLQAAVLERTRDKLEALEARIAELEGGATVSGSAATGGSAAASEGAAAD